MLIKLSVLLKNCNSIDKNNKEIMKTKKGAESTKKFLFLCF